MFKSATYGIFRRSHNSGKSGQSGNSKIMALIGSIESFNPKKNEITSYLERLEQLFKCNNITTEEKKVPLLLTLIIGGEAYGVLKDLLAPVLPSTKTFEELVAELKKHYSSKRLVISRITRRYNRFYSKIKKLSQVLWFWNIPKWLITR